MRDALRQKIIAVCDKKILAKGETVGVSFYAFFANKNDDPALLMEAATWWIQAHRLDHFEKALIYRALGQTSLAFQEVDLAAETLGNQRNVSDKFFALHFDRLKSHLYFLEVPLG